MFDRWNNLIEEVKKRKEQKGEKGTTQQTSDISSGKEGIKMDTRKDIDFVQLIDDQKILLGSYLKEGFSLQISPSRNGIKLFVYHGTPITLRHNSIIRKAEVCE